MEGLAVLVALGLVAALKLLLISRRIRAARKPDTAGDETRPPA